MGDKDFAIVVGISHYYHDNDLGPLDGAVEDAKKFFAWLASSEGGALPTSNIKLILSTHYPKPQDFNRAQPMLNDINEALIAFGMNKSIRSLDRLYFYFTGHGLGIEFDDVALLLANASRKKPYDNIGLRKYRIHLRNASPYKHLLFFLDCCRNLDISIEGEGPRQGPQQITEDAYNVEDYIFFATSYGRKAFEPPDPVTTKRRGLFTKALLEALDEKKAADPLLRVTAWSLDEYLSRRVPQLAKETGTPRTQEPKSYWERGDFLLVRAGSLPHVNIRVTADPGLDGFFVLSDGAYKEIARHDVAHTPWDFNLKVPGLFSLVHSSSEREEIINTREIRDTPHVYHFGR